MGGCNRAQPRYFARHLVNMLPFNFFIMKFPESDRVIYATNPLERVVCQLRFPPILRIETELPARFQEAIRDQYPIFNELSFPGIPQDMLSMMRSILPNASRTYEFTSGNGAWKLTISKEAIALECGAGWYTTWEE